MVVAAAEHELHRVGTQRGADRLQRLGDLERVAAHVDRDTAEPVREVAGVGEQPVGDVDHRGRPGLGGHPARVVRRLRAPVGLDQHPGRAEAPAEHREPPGGPALPAEQREHVAGLGAGAQHRRVVHAPITVTAITTCVGAGQVAADDAGADRARTRRRSRGRSPAPTPPAGRPGRPGRWSARCAAPAHRVDVGEVLRGRPVPDVLGPAQSRRKCRPSTIRSVETTTWPVRTRSTAASSPGPTSTCSPWGNRSVSAAIRPNSPTSARVASGGGPWPHPTRRTDSGPGRPATAPIDSADRRGRLAATPARRPQHEESRWSSRPTS